MLTKNEKNELSKLVMGPNGLAAGMAYDLDIDPAALKRAKAIMQREIDRVADKTDVDKNVVYTMHLLHSIIMRQDLLNDRGCAHEAADFERWYEDQCEGFVADDFYVDWGREPVDMDAARAEFDRLVKKGGGRV